MAPFNRDTRRHHVVPRFTEDGHSFSPSPLPPSLQFRCVNRHAPSARVDAKADDAVWKISIRVSSWRSAAGVLKSHVLDRFSRTAEWSRVAGVVSVYAELGRRYTCNKMWERYPVGYVTLLFLLGCLEYTGSPVSGVGVLRSEV